MTFDALDMAEVLSAGFVRQAEHHPVIGSTNDRARELATDASCRLPLLVVADLQTAGRGRGANRWWTGEGSLALSLLLNPAAHGVVRESCGLLSLAAAVAIVETLRPILHACLLGLHWPNDVYVADRKIAGVLVEALPDGRHVLGIGLNVNNSLAQAPAELQLVATTLFDLTHARHARQAIMSALLENLAQMIERLAAAPATIGRRCNDLCLQHGRELTLEHGQELVTGRCLGVADDGALLLQTQTGLRRFYAGVLRRT